ncbi:hypothetical protein HaLaN_15835 [Haematococcus lacustris]|uniref:Uncharacterized protein n=1 Tax=Haematococcus lacustris TaxID=44745 RepID=A0A699ZB75_HAELA|nr:hypothetical protein HaLaN_15835 [Haematococcus lacustris]
MAAWQLDMVPWERSHPTNLLTRPPQSPTPYALTPTSKCQAQHIFIDTRGLYDLMNDAGMLGVLTEAGVTSEDKFRNGALPDPANPGHYIEGPKTSLKMWPTDVMHCCLTLTCLLQGVAQLQWLQSPLESRLDDNDSFYLSTF